MTYQKSLTPLKTRKIASVFPDKCGNVL